VSLEQKYDIWRLYSSTGALNPFIVQIDRRLSARLYPDCRPSCLETAPLQKGLVLLLDGEEVIGEGVGFGVPVVKYKDKTYFSSSAKSWFLKDKNQFTLVKSFSLDTISRKRVGKGSYVNDKLYHFLHRAFELAYLNHVGLAMASNKVMEMRKTLGIETEFVKVKPRGTVTVNYSFSPDEIKIAMEFSLLELAQCKEILILNEQDSTFFRRYADSAGLLLFDRQIGAWTKIVANEASFADSEQTLKFVMKNKPSTPLFRGWEKTKDRFCWAGLAYSLTPVISTFQYSIKLSLGKEEVPARK
jgi:hypothetical protein